MLFPGRKFPASRTARRLQWRRSLDGAADRVKDHPPIKRPLFWPADSLPRGLSYAYRRPKLFTMADRPLRGHPTRRTDIRVLAARPMPIVASSAQKSRKPSRKERQGCDHNNKYENSATVLRRSPGIAIRVSHRTRLQKYAFAEVWDVDPNRT